MLAVFCKFLHYNFCNVCGFLQVFALQFLQCLQFFASFCITIFAVFCKFLHYIFCNVCSFLQVFALVTLKFNDFLKFCIFNQDNIRTRDFCQPADIGLWNGASIYGEGS